MPADEHELLLALEDGVEFKELLAPVRLEDGMLVCNQMALGEPDASGRAGVVPNGKTKKVPADTVIAAVGEKVPTDFYESCGIHVDSKGRALVSEHLETNLPGVYVIGDGLYGPSLVVKGMAQAIKAAENIAGKPIAPDKNEPVSKEAIRARKGILKEPGSEPEADRCLGCSTVCENCVDVCPNRANIAVQVPGMDMAQIIHVDDMCNECGNCKSFCPYASAPYQDKFTLFADEAAMADSKNEGFTVLDKEALKCRVRYLGEEFVWEKGQQDGRLFEGLQRLIEAVVVDYGYLM